MSTDDILAEILMPPETLMQRLESDGRHWRHAYSEGFLGGQIFALRGFADSTRFPDHWILFRRDDGSGVTVGDLLRETAANIEASRTGYLHVDLPTADPEPAYQVGDQLTDESGDVWEPTEVEPGFQEGDRVRLVRPHAMGNDFPSSRARIGDEGKVSRGEPDSDGDINVSWDRATEGEYVTSFVLPECLELVPAEPESEPEHSGTWEPAVGDLVEIVSYYPYRGRDSSYPVLVGERHRITEVLAPGGSTDVCLGAGPDGAGDYRIEALKLIEPASAKAEPDPDPYTITIQIPSIDPGGYERAARNPEAHPTQAHIVFDRIAEALRAREAGK